jgi:MFS family permease
MILAIGIGIVAVSSALVGIAQNYPELLLLRGAGGIGSALFSVSATTLLLGSVPATQRGRSMGIFQGGFLIGGMAGPAIGGVLAAISLRAPFFFYAGTLVIAGVVGLVLLQPATTRVSSAAQPAIPLGTVLRDRRFRAACIANFAQGWGSIGVRSTLIPVLIVELLHETAVWTGIAFAIAAVAQTLSLGPAGRFVDTVGRRPAIIGAYLVGAATLLAIPFAGSMWLLIVLLCLYGVAAAFMGTAPAAAVGDAAEGRSGKPVAIFSAFSDAGAIVGPLAAGALLDAFSYPAAFASAASLMLIAALYAIRMPRLAPPVAQPVAA